MPDTHGSQRISRQHQALSSSFGTTLCMLQGRQVMHWCHHSAPNELEML